MGAKWLQIGIFGAGCAVASGFWAAYNTGHFTSPASHSASHTALTCATQLCKGNPPLLNVNGQDLGLTDLPFDVQQQLSETQSRQFSEITQILDDAAVRIAVASERGLKDFKNIATLTELVGGSTVTDAQIKNYYEQRKNNFPPKMKYADLVPQIRQILKNTVSQEATLQKRNELRQFAKVKLKISPPIHDIIKLDLTGLPESGAQNQDGVVTLVEVTNYTCERCAWSKPQLDEILKKENGKFRLVRVVADLKNSIFADFMARGAYCALQKSNDTFWAFDVRAYTPKPTGLDLVSSAEEEKRISRAHVLKIGQEAGLTNQAELAQCVDSEPAQAYAKHNAELAKSAGITTLPAFVVNGQRHTGGVETLARTLNNAHDAL